MSQIAIVGCGIIGAAIAYELSLVPGLKITVLDKQTPAQGATSASLGVLVGIISQKIKGKAWQLRQATMQRYETLIPELETITGKQIPFNRQGILHLFFTGDNLEEWRHLAEVRHSQGWQLEVWDTDQVQSRCPQLNTKQVIGAVYSPQDRQLDPTALTLALVDAAQRNGVTFQFGVSVEGVKATPPHDANLGICDRLLTTAGEIDLDWLVVAAGLGSAAITASLQQPVDIRPVLGQALQVKLPQPLGNPEFQPVVTGDDVHIVPLGAGEYWVGATVEFPNEEGNVVADPVLLDTVMQQAIEFCPELAKATVIKTWSGLRPRPQGRPAPIIEKLAGYSNVLLATGHYRNGILLAPVTAQKIRDAIAQG